MAILFYENGMSESLPPALSHEYKQAYQQGYDNRLKQLSALLQLAPRESHREIFAEAHEAGVRAGRERIYRAFNDGEVLPSSEPNEDSYRTHYGNI